MKKIFLVGFVTFVGSAIAPLVATASFWGYGPTPSNLFVFSSQPVNTFCQSGSTGESPSGSQLTQSGQGISTCNSGFDLTIENQVTLPYVTAPHYGNPTPTPPTYGTGNPSPYGGHTNGQPPIGFGGFFSGW